MADNQLILGADQIKNRIYTIRGLQVMLDTDLAELYGVPTKALNRAVKRNLERFPQEFMFQLTEIELENLRSQFVTSRSNPLRSQFVTLKFNSLRCQNGTSIPCQGMRSQFATSKSNRGGRTYRPFAFTEQGVAMLSGVLKSSTAVRVSVQIMNAFVAMRRFIASNVQIFQRLDIVEKKQIATDKRVDEIFDAIQSKDIKPEKGIFFDGQIFDAYAFVSGLIRSAKQSIILVDNYVDDSVLTVFNKRRGKVNVTIFTKNISGQLKLDLEKYNSQYPLIEVKEFKQSHDRFLIIDGNEVYHLGASLKDLGKKWFAFAKFDKEAVNLLVRLGLG